MSKYFSIDGYYKDDKSEFYGYIVREFDDVDEELDDHIFFYGLSEDEIKQAIDDGGENNICDFVITAYEEINREDI
jgi:hypothetical protein